MAFEVAVWHEKINVGIEISHSSFAFNNMVGHYDRNPAFGSLDKSNAFGVKSIDPKLYVDYLLFDPVSVTFGLTYAWNVSFWRHSKSDLIAMSKNWEYPEAVSVMDKLSNIPRNGYTNYFIGLGVDIWKFQLNGRFSRNIGDLLKPFHYKGEKYTFHVNKLNYSLMLMYKFEL